MEQANIISYKLQKMSFEQGGGGERTEEQPRKDSPFETVFGAFIVRFSWGFVALLLPPILSESLDQHTAERQPSDL